MTSPQSTKALIETSGIRATRVRCNILEYLLRNCCHPTAEELKDALTAEGAKVPAATLYQNLEKLSLSGLLVKFPGPAGETRYDSTVKNHHHLICTKCSNVVDIFPKEPLPEVELVEEKSRTIMAQWSIEKVSVEFSGICPSCQSL